MLNESLRTEDNQLAKKAQSVCLCRVLGVKVPRANSNWLHLDACCTTNEVFHVAFFRLWILQKARAWRRMAVLWLQLHSCCCFYVQWSCKMVADSRCSFSKCTKPYSNILGGFCSKLWIREACCMHWPVNTGLTQALTVSWYEQRDVILRLAQKSIDQNGDFQVYKGGRIWHLCRFCQAST